MENDKERDGIVTLVDDEGVRHDFEIIDVFPVEVNQYAVLVPVNYSTESDNGGVEPPQDAYIFRIEKNAESGEDTLVEVEDEGEWNRVALEWENRIKLLEDEESEEL